MAKSFSERRSRTDHQDLFNDDFMGLLIDDEYIHRQNTKQTRLLRGARLKIYLLAWKISITAIPED